ncbi:MAG: hypothetical protein AAB602_02230 [Patescibacteria group bacterium]
MAREKIFCRNSARLNGHSTIGEGAREVVVALMASALVKKVNFHGVERNGGGKNTVRVSDDIYPGTVLVKVRWTTGRQSFHVILRDSGTKDQLKTLLHERFQAEVA